MPLSIVRNDLVKMHVDVIVNSANPKPVVGAGVDGRIHKYAGKELYALYLPQRSLQLLPLVKTPVYR